MEQISDAERRQRVIQEADKTVLGALVNNEYGNDFDLQNAALELLNVINGANVFRQRFTAIQQHVASWVLQAYGYDPSESPLPCEQSGPTD